MASISGRCWRDIGLSRIEAYLCMSDTQINVNDRPCSHYMISVYLDVDNDVLKMRGSVVRLARFGVPSLTILRADEFLVLCPRDLKNVFGIGNIFRAHFGQL